MPVQKVKCLDEGSQWNRRQQVLNKSHPTRAPERINSASNQPKTYTKKYQCTAYGDKSKELPSEKFKTRLIDAAVPDEPPVPGYSENFQAKH